MPISITPISTTPISTIQFTSVPGMQAIVEPGHCDPNDACGVQCGTCQWVTGIPPAGPWSPVGTSYDCCTVGDLPPAGQNWPCGRGLVPKSVPIKQLINGSSIAPWVKIRFEQGSNSASTEITTGNISQPYNAEGCKAAVKSFQYSWGTIGQGNKCKVTIVDEYGTSFKNWVDRIVKNPETASQNTNQGVYKMRVNWGWVITGGNGTCPSDGRDTSDCNTTTYKLPNGKTVTVPIPTAKSTILCSAACYFLPNAITVNMQNNGKFVYEIEGVDLLQRSTENSSQRIFGTSMNNMHFTDACKCLAATSLPPFNIDFKQYDNAGNIVPLLFHPTPNTGIANRPGQPPAVQGPAATQTDLVHKGPQASWRCQAYNPLSTLHSWIKDYGVMAANPVSGQRGRGITFNYDPTYFGTATNISTTACPIQVDSQPTKGLFTVWADALPSGANLVNVQSRLKALYVVNGGKCSPVLSFTPQMKWNFSGVSRIGGSLGTNSGTALPASSDSGANSVGGTGFRSQPSPTQEMAEVSGSQQAQIYALANQRRANQLHHSIEAELRVQGDPSDWLCTPLLGYGKCVSLIVINPFSLEQGSKECPEWNIGPLPGQCNGANQPVCVSSCNEILTNRAWYVMGVDHQIKEGSYVTTLKLTLFAPGGDSNATVQIVNQNNEETVPQALGGGTAGSGYVFCPNDGGNAGLSPGTISPQYQMASGAIKQNPGTGESDDPACEGSNTVIWTV